MKNKTKKTKKSTKLDVYSTFAEDNIEFVNRQDEREAIAHVLYSQEKEFLNHEREYYDQNH